MGSYFHGWRRKIGVFTLVLACVLMAVWVRSLVVVDYVELPVGKHTSVFLITYPRFFTVFIEHDPDINLPPSLARWLSHPTAKFSAEDFAAMNYESLHSTIKYRNHPPVVPKGPNQPIRVPVLSSDYSLIGLPVTYLFAIPPTLIAAYLLLSKRREPNPESAPRQDRTPTS